MKGEWRRDDWSMDDGESTRGREGGREIE